jgi:hypothetical protein
MAVFFERSGAPQETIMSTIYLDQESLTNFILVDTSPDGEHDVYTSSDFPNVQILIKSNRTLADLACSRVKTVIETVLRPTPTLMITIKHKNNRLQYSPSLKATIAKKLNAA